MPIICLPDGSKREFNTAVSVAEVARDIGEGLYKATLAGIVNGKLVDASYSIDQDATLKLVTARDPEGLQILRHSTAHLLAQAVKQLYPHIQVTVGPVIEDGFYYDFANAHPFTPEDLEKIEAKMKQIVKESAPVERQEMPRDEAIAFFENMGETYKAEIIRDIPQDEVLSLYRQGDFIDLCRGPHVPHLGYLKAFKLMKVSGAYWRGDANNEMLQRVYGTAWANKKDLKAYLHRIEEAEKRDHRKLGKLLDLFHWQSEAPGMTFWHEKGWTLYRTVEDYIRRIGYGKHYFEIKTPMILDMQLWQKSGHADKYYDEMFVTETDKRNYALKPMSCPGHVQLFNQGLKSYKDLPLRYGEFGVCHRSEPSGALHGLMRLRGFVQDDGHIFCAPAQIKSEVTLFMDQALKIYKDFGFDDLQIKLATRPDKRIGDDAVWDHAESSLTEALNEYGIQYDLLPGEGAFYGPKVELHLNDCLGRTWQCGTMQVDFFMPERLGSSYVDEHGERQPPVLMHRAILGSLERFIGIVIEHYAGKLPLWLAPVQAVILNISEKQSEYVTKIEEKLRFFGINVNKDLRNEKIGYKIREHTLQNVPYILVVGDKEVENESVSVRKRDGEDLGVMSVTACAEYLQNEIANKGHANRRINN